MMNGRSNLHPSGRSAAWLARLPWEQEVECSNHSAPTIMNPFRSTSCFIFCFDFTRSDFMLHEVYLLWLLTEAAQGGKLYLLCIKTRQSAAAKPSCRACNNPIDKTPAAF